MVIHFKTKNEIPKKGVVLFIVSMRLLCVSVKAKQKVRHKLG